MPDILIVDDEPRNLQLLGNLLRENGYRTSFATSGMKALEIARLMPPRLILLDINLPGMDGLSVCRALREDALPELRAVPIIFLTARAQPEDIVEGFAAGGVDYVTKPFHSPELLARVKTHLELRRAREELSRINENQRRFVTVLAHDLRNPVGGLKEMPNLLLDPNDPPTMEFVRDIATLMRDESRRVFDLLEELLLLSKLQMGRASPLEERFPLRGVIDHVIDQFDVIIRQKRLQLDLDVPAELEAYADHHMISMIVRNLVQNALKFSSAGGRVLVSACPCVEEDPKLHRDEPSGLERGAEHRSRICVSVTDNGVGVRPELAAYLFDAQYSRSTTGTNQETGSGLGLPMCAQLLELHGARLHVESPSGGGARFYFYLSGTPPVG